ncbi:MAG: cell division protein FtsQ/DivIB [Pirellulales bacterium]
MKSATTAPRRGLVAGLIQVLALPLRGPVASFSAFFILLVFFAGGFSYVWQRWGGLVRNHPRYAIVPEQIEITPQPEWIQSQVKDEVVRDGNLATLSLLDPQVTVKVAHEFGLHCWVADVKRVRKEYPSRIFVDLEYRRPVAMVEVVTNGQRGLLPVDAQGVLLPPQDFSAEQTREYLRIAVGDTLPVGSAGTSWGDPDVAAAAGIAATLRDAWRPARLYRITLTNPGAAPRDRSADRQFDLLTRDGVKIHWGHAPGQEVRQEPAAADKVARLMRYLEARGTLTPLGDQPVLDLREPVSLPAAQMALPTVFR